MDPLQELRLAVTLGRTVELEDDNAVVLDETKFAGSTPTSFWKDQKKAAHANIASLVFFYQNRSTGFGAYVTAATKRKLDIVIAAHKDYLVSFIEGKVEADARFVDTSFQAQSSAAPTSAQTGGVAVAKVVLDPGVALDIAIRNEIPYRTRYNVLDCGNKSLKDQIYEHFNRVEDEEKKRNGQVPAAAAKRPAAGGGVVDESRKRARTAQGDPAAFRPPPGTPIIILPPTASSLINMYNAEEFFARSNFVPVDPHNLPPSKPDVLTISRVDTRGHTAKFYVTDNVNRIKPGEWYKVCAVVVAGPEWQFKGWTWGKLPSVDPKTGVSTPAPDCSAVTIFERGEPPLLLLRCTLPPASPPFPSMQRWACIST